MKKENDELRGLNNSHLKVWVKDKKTATILNETLVSYSHKVFSKTIPKVFSKTIPKPYPVQGWIKKQIEFTAL